MTCVNLTMVKSLFLRTEKRVKYKLGAKAPSLDADSASLTRIDCSGYVRWLVHRATEGSVTLPDGSQAQREWCEAHWKPKKYADLHFAQHDSGRLFIAFLSPKPGKEWPRHVFLVVAGRTIEAAGGNMGCVGSRKWDEFKGVAACYEVPVC